MTTAGMVDAEEARQVCSKALIKIATGQIDAAVALLEDFGGRCGRIAQGAQMAEEVAQMHDDRISLAELRVDLRQDGPEHDRD